MMRARPWFVVSLALSAAASSCTSATAPPAAPTATHDVAVVTVAHEHYTVRGELERCKAAPCAIRATVTPKAPFHANAEYPHRFVSDDDGVLSDGAVAPIGPDGLLRVSAQLQKPAGAPFQGRLFMSVCSDEKCLIEKVPLSM
jgi:hypothetical protein